MDDRRTAHGMICRCGSLRVVLRTTRTERMSVQPDRRELEKKQECLCLDCGARGWRKIAVVESLIFGQWEFAN